MCMEQKHQLLFHSSPKEPCQGAVLSAAGKGKIPPGPVPICQFLPDPNSGDRLFPEHVSHTSQEMPMPFSPSTWSQLRGFRELPKCSHLINLGVRILPVPVRAAVAAPRHWDPWKISAPHCLWLVPLAPWGMRMVVLLKKGFPWSGRSHPAEKDMRDEL